MRLRGIGKSITVNISERWKEKGKIKSKSKGFTVLETNVDEVFNIIHTAIENSAGGANGK